ncbi:hypothetical protein [Syntrophotalea acetylenica]|uniref:ATP-binding protein n=1 Tax=Syntrophotalea acetylenica TaxID=29542 RepID=A0A1L3GE70_SYNAC|nr:hypothetical protein [Syntrophotalea acetylenica]APG24256.1 hypothetical protein A7E75_03805 [Syntrophotalea acetylenica]APG44836.1 hypothetical protein A6070_12435 [Syntrophotalea acetylenica]
MSEKKHTEKRVAADRLIDLASGIFLFKSPEKEPYAIYLVDGAKHCDPVESKAFGHYLARLYYEAEGSAITATALDTAVRQLAAKARFEGQTLPLFVRTAPCRNGLAIDLGDDSRLAVLVTPNGYQIGEPQFPFRRGSNTATFPAPEPGGDLAELFDFVNITNPSGQRMIIAWLLHTFLTGIPHVVLVLEGAQGSAKSTASCQLVSLTDPSQAPLLALPSSERDLMISAATSWVLVFDNLRRLPPEVSDQICRLVTGGGLRTRKLYTNDDEMLFTAKRVVVLNGIHGIVKEQDLLSRSLVVTLAPFGDAGTRSDEEVAEAFERVRPRILGALMTALSGVLRELPAVQVTDAPRMADFARVGVAAERVLGWPEGAFLAAYRQSLGHAVSASLEDDVVAQSLGELVTREEVWEGTTGKLLQRLGRLVPKDVHRSREWPKSPNWLSNRLRRLAPGLPALGIAIEFDLCLGGEKRVLRVTRVEETASRPEVAADNEDAPAVVAGDETLQTKETVATAANTSPSLEKDKGGIAALRIRR